MKIIKYTLPLLVAAGMLVSCEGTDNTPDTPQSKIELIPSTDHIDATGSEDQTVTFTILSGEEDVTAEARVFMSPDNKELINKSFSTTTPGDYNFYATYRGTFSDTITVTANGGLTLISDKVTITADGTDAATFTVTQDGEDVTTESTLYLVPEEGEPVAIDGNTFSTSEVGGHNIYATKGALSSNTVAVLATPDSTPEQWSFKERSLIIEITGTWCGPCSMLKAGVKMLEQDGWDDGYVVEAHDNDALSISAFNPLISYLGLGSQFGVPLMRFNFADEPEIGGAHGSDVSVNADNVRQATEQANEAYPCTSGANAVYLSDEDGTLTVTSDVAISEAGEYKVSCWLLENNIRMSQTTLSAAQEWNVSTHINVLRGVSDDGDFAGQTVTAGANETQQFHWSFSTSDLRNGEPEETHVLVIISRKEADGKYIVNNVIKCGYNDAVDFEYE